MSLTDAIRTPDDRAPAARGTAPEIKRRLYGMMFLQYFVQGCYLPIASVYVLQALNFTPHQMGAFSSALAVGPLFAPFLLGQIVDRHVSTERALAFCHLAAGAMMLLLYKQTSFYPVVILGTLYSILYVPSMMLTNSLAFHHLKDRDREFPLVRLWGTVGFIVPAWLIELYWLHGLSGDELNKARSVAFLLSGAVGLVMGFYSLSLPHTPPAKNQGKSFAPGEAIRQLKYRHILVLVSITLGIAIVHQFFFSWNSPFLETLLREGGVRGAWEQRISSIGQISEIGVMAVLGAFITRFGFKVTMTAGAVAYTARCLILALAAWISGPFALRMGLACLGQAMHGACFGCFLAAAFMYIDRVSPPNVRGSMQNLFGTTVLGLGFFLGGLVAGEVGDLFTTGEGPTAVRNLTGIWLSCGMIAAVCLAAFVWLFPARVPDQAEER